MWAVDEGEQLVSTLETGRVAIQRHDWESAVEALRQSDAEAPLGGDDLVMLADACWWTGHPDEANEVLERAFRLYVGEERLSDAAAVGASLAYYAIRNQTYSVAAAWIHRVETLLEDQPLSKGHAWLSINRVGNEIFVNRNLGRAIALADESIRVAREVGVPGVEALATSFKGIALIQTGEWQEGLAMIDEAAGVAMSEGSDMHAVSDVYCNTIAACANLGEYRRAGEWTDRAEQWMSTNRVGGYTGVCKVHRAELKRLRGSWSEAEETARDACVELERFHLMDGIGFAYYEIGEVRRRMGDLDSAEEAFLTAYESGHGSQPGVSLLMADKGDLKGAQESIATALARRAGDDGRVGSRLSRARLLPAQVEISLMADDINTARTALEELEEVASSFDATVWKANAETCRGAVHLHVGEFDDAIESLGNAWIMWRDLVMPYEAARTRILLGKARRGAGDEMEADREFKAAASALRKLGAARDLRAVEVLTGRPLATDRVTKVFMFTDIVTSTDLIGLIGDDAWKDLLNWHDRTLREVLVGHGGDVVRHTGDGYFVAFEDAKSAIDAAVAVQRRLAAHRRDHGFAPWVRIGLHVAEATRSADDYSGGGVHVAARVGDIGAREEIVVSRQVIEGMSGIGYEVSEARQVRLKGVAEPVEVHTVEWQ